MEISWYGLSCFRLSERGMATIVTDPYDQQVDVMVKAVGNLQRAVEWVETRLTYGSA